MLIAIAIAIATIIAIPFALLTIGSAIGTTYALLVLAPRELVQWLQRARRSSAR